MTWRANLPPAPADARTGIPLAIAPRSDIASIPERLLNEHHHWYPRLSPELQTIGGLALRASRVQRVHIAQHNAEGPQAFHHVFGPGVRVPDSIGGQVGLCVIQIAGYLPDMVADTSHGEPTVRRMLDWEERGLKQPRQFGSPSHTQVKRYRDKWMPHQNLRDAKHKLLKQRQKQAEMTYRDLHYGYDPVKRLLVDFVLDQDLSEVKPAIRHRFLSTGDKEAGMNLLGIAAQLAAGQATVKGVGLESLYKTLKREGRLHPKMPDSATSLIKYKLGNDDSRVYLLDDLRMHMLGAEEGVV